MSTQKSVVIGAEGLPLAFYSSEIHGGNIPPDAFNITDEQWLECIENPGRRRFVEGALVEYTPAPVPPPVPTITKAQALLYLLAIGKTNADVVSAIATIADPVRRAVAAIEWDYRQPFHHDHPLFVSLGPALGITDMEAAFRVASTL